MNLHRGLLANAPLASLERLARSLRVRVSPHATHYRDRLLDAIVEGLKTDRRRAASAAQQGERHA